MHSARSLSAVALCLAMIHLAPAPRVRAQAAPAPSRAELEDALLGTLLDLLQRWRDSYESAGEPQPQAGNVCTDPHAPLLPDMIVDSQNLEDHVLSTSCDDLSGVQRCLRVSVGTINVGQGDLLLTAPVGQQDQVTEHITTCSGGQITAPVPSAFVDEPSHQHLHLRDWTELRLRKIDSTCDREDTAANCPVIGIGHKVSFCLLDTELYDLVLGRDGGELYCGVDQGGTRIVQGISSGWKDVYNRSLPGQLIDVTNLDSGDYWLEVEVNPGHAVVEADYANNVARVRTQLDLPRCGDGVLSAGELCDGSTTSALPACTSLGQGFAGGETSCDATCQINTSACTRVECPQQTLGSALGAEVASGAAPTGPNAFTGTHCDFTAAQTGSEITFSWTAPSTGTFAFDTHGSSYDTVLYLLGPACEALPNIRNTCNDDAQGVTTSEVSLRMVQGEQVVVAVDSYSPEAEGQFVLNVNERVEPAETRAPALATVQ